MKIGLGIAVAAVLSSLAWLLIAPVLSAQELQRALRDNDTTAIQNVVNFPALRENLRGTLGSSLAGQRGETLEPGAAFSAALAGLMMGPIVDALVTPAGLSTLFKGGVGTFTGQTASNNIRVASGLQSLNKYAITLTDLDNPASVVTLVLMPTGLQWQLTAIEFPAGAFKR